MHPEALTNEGKELLPILKTLPELAATKAYTIGRRGSFKDYVDLYFAIGDKMVALPEIIKLAEEKYGHAFNARLFLEQLVYLEDISDTDIVFLREVVSKERLAGFFAAEIRQLEL
ncbi:MAG: hypothetical protein AAB642_03095 [Patescibacteria group bacterium]